MPSFIDNGGPSIRSSLTAVRDTPRYTYLVAAMAAIGGMLFGYDIGVISGAEKLLTTSFHLSSGTEELAVAAVLIGAVAGGVIGGPMANRFSRRYTLLTMAILYAIGAISGGILISYLLDFAFDSAGWGWRPMFAAAVLPATALAIGMLVMSHSPRWLGMRERWDDAGAVLERINPREKQQELDLLRRNVTESAQTSWRELLRPGMRGALIAGVGLAIFQQFVGPNTVLFYTPTIFGFAGVTGNPLLPTIYVGAVLFVFVLPTIAFVDVVGRKMLFYLGLIGMGSMLVLLGVAFGFGAKSWGFGVVLILLVYVACYSLSISPLFWLMSAEVFPNRLRGAGASAATVANWSANLLVSVTFLSLINAVGKSWTFWIYAIFAALAIVFVWRFVPETKGRRLESIDRYWTQGRRWPDSDAPQERAA